MIYYSRSNDVEDLNNEINIRIFINLLAVETSKRHGFIKHKRGTVYSIENFKKADIVIVAVKDYDRVIGRGCYGEIIMALNLKKPVFLLSEEQRGNIYLFELNKEHLQILSDDFKEYARIHHPMPFEILFNIKKDIFKINNIIKSKSIKSIENIDFIKF